MKVAAVAILCQDERVFEAMEQAGTPCPFEGKIGQQAKAAWQKYNKLRPDHNTYIQNLKIKEEADVEEQNEITKDMQEVDKPKTNWKEPK
jgi:outer membrane receptor for Fe3+-dicitrate